MSEELNPDLKKVDDFLDAYENKIGLRGISESDVSKYLSMNQDGLQKMSADDCAEAAFILTKEALFVQHEINKYQAQMDWAKARIDRTIAGDLHNHGTRFSTFETRQTLAIKSNSATQNLQKIVDRANRIITRINYLPNHLRNLANVYLDIRHTKVRSEYESTRINQERS